MTRTVYRTCPLCEATCGLELRLEGRDIALVRGDRDDVFSRGFLCPKGTALKQLESDPDRLRRPLVRRGDDWLEVSSDDAFAEVEQGLAPILEEHGRDAVAVYLGNPNVHNLAGTLYNRVLLQALGTGNVYSASTVDQMPKQVSAGLMFGTALSIPIPDVDRTDHLMVLGANPFASNGSLMTAPDFPGRLRALRARGGKLVVVDPRRSKTAEEADEHLFIRPGTDAHFLFAIVHTLFAERLNSLGDVADHVNGVQGIERLARDFAPDAVAPVCGIDAETIRRSARELASAPRAAVYGRIGTCTQEFGTLASWLVDVVVAGLVQRAVQRTGSNVEGRDPDELMAALSPRRGPERIIDLMLRTGPYGDGFGADPSGLSLEVLEANPHGIDLGPLEPRIPEVLRTPSGKIELAPEPIIEDVARLRESLARGRNGEMVLVGRRDLRSNNSWMHNVDVLVRGKDRCTLHLHPDDASRLRLEDGASACVRSGRGEVAVTVEVTDAIMPGVVSIPHGWGHDRNGADLSVAAKRPGVNSNLLADGELFDPLSGNAVLNGIPVRVEPLAPPAPA